MMTTRQRIQHLLRRTGFGYSAAELGEYVALELDGSVERLLRPGLVDDSVVDSALAPVLAVFDAPGDPQDPSVRRAHREALWAAWYLRMTRSRRPLVERMTYFWHDHFATSIGKVDSALLMHRQNELLRRNALGSFRDLLLGVARDPAMLIYLDNRTNARQAPNENYARELLELHTLGEGNGYTEQDIKEAARALTGWRIGEARTAVFRPNLFDSGRKTVLGQTGNLNDATLVDLLAGHPRVARYIAGKLVAAFVRPEGDTALRERATATYLRTSGSISEVMRTILLSDEMYAPAAYRAIIKSPTELIVGAKRALEIAAEGRTEVEISNRMGQRIYDPLNPAGWAGGEAWLNGTTMLARSNFIAQLTALGGNGAVDIPGLLRRNGVTGSASAVVDWVLDLLVGGDVDAASREVLIDHIGGVHFNFDRAAREGTLHGLIYLAMCMPLYQVA
ncbi:MAG: DUF1800 domain-containing protein [Chloroflexi bacterium]|nr:MAG: DUF1800 domain-containing protein [Chloroflexota bacterium]